MTASTAYTASGGDLSVSFRIGRDGRQHVAAELVSLYGAGTYYAVR